MILRHHSKGTDSCDRGCFEKSRSSIILEIPSITSFRSRRSWLDSSAYFFAMISDIMGKLTFLRHAVPKQFLADVLEVYRVARLRLFPVREERVLDRRGIATGYPIIEFFLTVCGVAQSTPK